MSLFLLVNSLIESTLDYASIITDMDDMLRKNNQPIKRAKQTPGEYDTCNDPECQICSQ